MREKLIVEEDYITTEIPLRTKTYAGIGARVTPKDICNILTKIAENLYVQGFHLRTGGATGADRAFYEGADPHIRGSGIRHTTFIPNEGARARNGNFNQIVPTASERSIELMNAFHPKPSALVGIARDLMLRNNNIILGEHLDDPVDFICCWTKGGEIIGGTGQGLRLADHFEIPVINFGKSDRIKIYYQTEFQTILIHE